tara:strand:+ start:1083 stop:1190 length:108 start_codon:yes stop_codon:yes gene_type:complete
MALGAAILAMELPAILHDQATSDQDNTHASRQRLQ